jgi:hypothetical protein
MGGFWREELWKGEWCDVVGVSKGIGLHASMYSEQRKDMIQHRYLG